MLIAAAIIEVRLVLDTSESRLNDLSYEADYVRALLAALPGGLGRGASVAPDVLDVPSTSTAVRLDT